MTLRNYFKSGIEALAVGLSISPVQSLSSVSMQSNKRSGSADELLEEIYLELSTGSKTLEFLAQGAW